MAYDGIVMHKAIEEMKKLQGGRVAKVYQPSQTELVLQVRAARKKHHVLISANPVFSRFHLTETDFDNPKQPPMFCMLLRKHLEGSIIENIEQDRFERVAYFDVSSTNEVGDRVIKRLVIEIMGRHSNIMLINKEDQMIIDSIKHLPPSVNSYRTIMPGKPYVAPPAQDKLSPLAMTYDQILERLNFNAGKLDRQFIQHIEGFSPEIGREIMFRANSGASSHLMAALDSVVSEIRSDAKPKVYSGDKEAFHVIHLTHLKADSVTFSTTGQMLDRFFSGKAERDQIKQKAGHIYKLLNNEINKNIEKQKKLRLTIKDSEQAQKYQLAGELLTANLHRVKQGMETIDVINYYDPDQSEMTIKLKTDKTPADNAQNYFKKYSKAKRARISAEEQLKKSDAEIEYLERLVQQMDSAHLEDLEDIEAELIEEGYLKKKKVSKNQNKRKKHAPAPEKYMATDGTEILVGKNNKQNEYLTMKLAKNNEIWLHTKDIPGSHVVIRTTEASDETLEEAAAIAAFYSKSRMSSSVPVDYTLVRHVRKPNGAKPGFVIYDNQKTLYVTPDEQLVKQLKSKK